MADLGVVIGYRSNDVFGRGAEILRTNLRPLRAIIASPDPTDIRADQVNYPAEAEVEQDLVFGNLNQYTGSSVPVPPPDPVGAIAAPLPPDPTGAING